MGYPIYQIDAFTDHVFAGNPAAVVPLPNWLPDETLMRIAHENNLSETAFFVKRQPDLCELRWFTPRAEVKLCGHATLATAFVLFEEWEYDFEKVRFETRSGELTASLEEDGSIAMDFPVEPMEPVDAVAGLAEALGAEPKEVLQGMDTMAVFADEGAVRGLEPDFRALARLETRGVIVTAKSGEQEVDFVSRFFAPAVGIDEDPVTGSAHCALAPYWSKKLRKKNLRARQVSRRGGEVFCQIRENDRIGLRGHAVLFMVGEIVQTG